MSKRFPQPRATTAAQERRHYLRLNSVLPVELAWSEPHDGAAHAETIQGYTQDVGEGGLCVQLFRLTAEQVRRLRDEEPQLRMTIRLLPFRQPVTGVARVAWIEEAPGEGGVHLGIAFDAVATADRQRLLRYARRIHWLPKVAAMSIAMLMATAAHLWWDLRDSTQARASLTTQLQMLTAREQVARQRFAAVEHDLAETQRLLATARATTVVAPAPVAAQAPMDVDVLSRRETALQDELRTLTQAKASAEAELLDHLYQWLRVHQYPGTGLVISYEGDSSLEDWAFTYDQALMAQCFLLFSDDEAAREVLEFFATRAPRVDGGFVNAYDAVSGSIREYAAHAGPNLWIGIAALQYTHASGDRQFVPLAVSIANWIRRLQHQDSEGGIRGGPSETWFSTEHNLDAYAFLTMLADLTGDGSYREDARRVLGWLKRHAHGSLPGQINRGRGDATIATDTFAWAIAAIGPETLAQEGFDPDAMLAFAEQHCAVTATMLHPDQGRVAVEGFDFSKPRHLPRGGVISTEWTGQMIVAMKLMEQFHQAAGREVEAARYRAKAEHYQSELEKLIIASPCPMGHPGWALPYASQGNVDTGHGWRTARGASTGSASGTVYHIFARTGFNPMHLDGTTRRIVAASPHAPADTAAR